MEMLMIICDRDVTKNILKLLNENDFKYHTAFYGKGTADKNILSYIGLTETQKEVIVSFNTKEKTIKIMEIFKKTALFINRGGAVALTVPVDYISKSTVEFIGL